MRRGVVGVVRGLRSGGPHPHPLPGGEGIGRRIARIALALSACTAALAQPAPVRLTPHPDGTVAVASPATPGAHCTALSFTLHDGRAKAAVTLPTPPGAQVGVAVKAAGAQVSVTLTNHGAAGAWLEPALTAQVAGDAPLTVWDGRSQSPGETRSAAAGPRGVFPLVCAWTSAGGVMLSWPPDAWFSYVRHTWQPTDARRGVLTVAYRIVLDPGRSETLTWNLAAIPGEYGFRHALDRYYRDHPAWFAPAPGVDSRVNLNGATYNAWASRPDPENCRRLRCGWEWCYAPFIRTGDLYVHDDLTKYEPARPFSPDRQVSAEVYRANRARQFLNGRPADVGMLCYLPGGVWCEERLARERYPAALTTDPQTKNYFDTPWCTGHDNELRVFPGAEPYARVLRDDMQRVWNENDIGGWAFDTAEGGARWQNPAAAGYPHGRAWDDDGVYVDEGVGIAELMDDAHRLRRGGRVAAVASNPTTCPSYLTPFRSDVLMVEGTPWCRQSGCPPEGLRWFAGHKTIVWWEDWLLEDLIDWEAMTPEEIRRAFRGLGDYAILESLRLGILPTPRMALGSPKVVRWTQVLADLVRRGWEPVPAVAGLPQLDRSRYGRGLTSAIGLGNKTARTVAGGVAVENGYLSDTWDMLYTPRDGGALRQTVGERRTRFAVSLFSREAAVYEARLGVAAGKRCEATVSAGRLRVTARLRGLRGRTALAAAPRDDAVVDRVTINGKPAAVDGQGRCTAALTGDDSVVVTYRSQTFDSTWQAVEGFDLAAAAVVADGPAALPAGQMVCDFIGRAVVAGGGQDPKLAPVAKAAGRRVALNVAPGLPRPRRVYTEGDVLAVAGRTPDELWQAVRDWLAAIEARHPYAGVFYRSPAADRAGLTGKALEP